MRPVALERRRGGAATRFVPLRASGGDRVRGDGRDRDRDRGLVPALRSFQARREGVPERQRPFFGPCPSSRVNARRAGGFAHAARELGGRSPNARERGLAGRGRRSGHWPAEPSEGGDCGVTWGAVRVGAVGPPAGGCSAGGVVGVVRGVGASPSSGVDPWGAGAEFAPPTVVVGAVVVRVGSRSSVPGPPKIVVRRPWSANDRPATSSAAVSRAPPTTKPAIPVTSAARRMRRRRRSAAAR